MNQSTIIDEVQSEGSLNIPGDECQNIKIETMSKNGLQKRN